MTEQDVFPGRSPVTHDCDLVSERHGPVRTVRVHGRLDWSSADKLRGLLRDECPEPAVLVDLLGVTGVDSAGTAVLLDEMVRADEQGQQLLIMTTNPVVVEVLDSVCFDRALPIVTSEAAALEWLDAHELRMGPSADMTVQKD